MDDMSLSLSASLSDTRQRTIHTHNLSLKAAIKGTPRILQTAKGGRKEKVSHSPKPKIAIFGVFTTSQSEFRLHRGINRAQHKRGEISATSLSKGALNDDDDVIA